MFKCNVKMRVQTVYRGSAAAVCANICVVNWRHRRRIIRTVTNAVLVSKVRELRGAVVSAGYCCILLPPLELSLLLIGPKSKCLPQTSSWKCT